MTVVQAAVLGMVQGITEFLPISSSGHLIVFPELLGWPEQGIVFDVAVHVATLLSIGIALRPEIASIARNLRKGKREDSQLLGKIGVATLPAVAVGLLLGAQLDRAHTMTSVAVMLIAWGVLLAVADAYAAARPHRRVGELSWLQALVIGVFQAFALVPGTSRSGATITGGLFLGLERQQAVRFSFLLAIPAILAAAAKTFFDAFHDGYVVEWMPMLVGFLAALVSGICAIKLLLYVVSRFSFAWFAVYRIAFGVFLLWIALR